MSNRVAQCRSLISALAISIVCACSSITKPPETSQNAVLSEEPNQSAHEDSSSATHAPTPAVSQAMKAIEGKRFDDAKSILTKAVAENGKDVLAHYYLGVAYAGLGDNSHAVSAYQKAISLDPKFAEAYVNLSALQLDARDADGALATVEQGLKSVDNPDLYLNKALALDALGKKDLSLEAYAAAVKHLPDNMSLRVTYAQLLAANGKKEEALAELRRIREATDPKLLALASITARELGAFADCVAILDRAIGQKDLAALHVRRGMCREDLKDEAGAKSDYERAIAMDSRFAPAHYYWGLMLRSNDKKKACAELLMASDLAGSQGIGPQAKKAASELGCR